MIKKTKERRKRIIPKKSYPFRGNSSKVKFLIYLLDTIIILAAIGILSTILPIIVNEVSYRFKNKNEKVYIPETITKDKEQKIKNQRQRTKVIYPVDPSFSIIIPKINVNYKIIANVNPFDEKEYSQALKRGVAHAKGTDFPGTGRKIYLFSHSSSSIWEGQVNIAFYLLKELKKGDKVYLFYRDRRYDYEVIEKIITGPDLKKYLTEDLNKDILILQTCYPPGTNLKRLIVIAKPI